jgi:hypothetical protein
MTPQEFNQVVAMIEAASKAAYIVGRDDEAAGAPVREFRFDVSWRLLLQREMNKPRKKR